MFASTRYVYTLAAALLLAILLLLQLQRCCFSPVLLCLQKQSWAKLDQNTDMNSTTVIINAWRIVLVLAQGSRRVRFRPGYEPSSRRLELRSTSRRAYCWTCLTLLAPPGSAKSGLDCARVVSLWRVLSSFCGHFSPNVHSLFQRIDTYQYDNLCRNMCVVDKELGYCPIEQVVRCSSPGLSAFFLDFPFFVPA